MMYHFWGRKRQGFDKPWEDPPQDNYVRDLTLQKVWNRTMGLPELDLQFDLLKPDIHGETLSSAGSKSSSPQASDTTVGALVQLRSGRVSKKNDKSKTFYRTPVLWREGKMGEQTTNGWWTVYARGGS